MPQTIGTYAFLPWLRQGIANQISQLDDGSVPLRASVPVTLTLAGEGVKGDTPTVTVTRTVQLFGPGDVVGIDKRAIIRTDPHHWITNYEPNYIPSIEFYDEDFPWRYTPAAPANGRLRPWIALVVLKTSEFENGTNIKGKPLPFITVQKKDWGIFPPADQLWAWAHVHVNRSLDDSIVSIDMAKVLPNLQATLNENPDLAYSRLICPRKLEANTAYDAFLLPTFETGRLAGLGKDPIDAPHATFSAWATYEKRQNQADANDFPVYYRWHFRTGSAGDFEYLVRLLQPRTVDRRVGTREMDVQKPGVNLPGINDQALGGILRLGGALRIPTVRPLPNAPEAVKKEWEVAQRYENWAQPYPHPFQQSLARLINLGADYTQLGTVQANRQSTLGQNALSPTLANDPDPMITPPLFGRWHAFTQRLLEASPPPRPPRPPIPPPPSRNWVNELNLDPRFRVAAGFGSKVVQSNQEAYMAAAWAQLGDVAEANRLIRLGQLGKAIGTVCYERHLRALYTVNPEKAFTLAAPLFKRLVWDNATLHHQLNSSVISTAPISLPMRRITQTRGRMMKQLARMGGQARPLLTRIYNGQVSAAPVKQAPSGAITTLQILRNLPIAIRTKLQRHPDLHLPPAIVDTLNLRPDLVLQPNIGLKPAIILQPHIALQPNVGLQPDIVIHPNIGVQRGAESARATTTPQIAGTNVRLKEALRAESEMWEESAALAASPPFAQLDLAQATTAMLESIKPSTTIPRRLSQTILLPAHLQRHMTERFVEVMDHPQFDIPMYKPLVDLSAELFLPNINLIPQNSITLLETNQKFIESYMVGLNHEFARELLWREYPTDQRGSYFRQFWSVESYFEESNRSEEQQREKLRDIPPLHKWSKASTLGSHDNRQKHDNRQQVGNNQEEVVLVIRGELLKKYPNAVIYAHQAEWHKNGEVIDKTKERKLVELKGAEVDNPPPSKVKTPLYEANVSPDIYFFGFDLTAEQAKGIGEDAGWFFVIKERPGEPRFGLDINRSGQLNVWNDLSWNDVLPNASAGAYLQVNNPTIGRVLRDPTDRNNPNAKELADKGEQYQDDKEVQWSKDATSADLAYILFQAPVLVAVHAAEMLKDL